MGYGCVVINKHCFEKFVEANEVCFVEMGDRKGNDFVHAENRIAPFDRVFIDLVLLGFRQVRRSPDKRIGGLPIGKIRRRERLDT